MNLYKMADTWLGLLTINRPGRSRMLLSRMQLVLVASSLIVCGAIPASGQIRELVNSQGATAPCVAVGLPTIVKNCVKAFEQAGFVRTNGVGTTGLTLGTSGNDDGLIVGIESGSPAASAGLAVGDAITDVEDKLVKLTPGIIATKQTFGQRGEPRHIKVRRNRSDLDITLLRDPRTAPRGPKSPSRFMCLRPMIDWRDQFIPCMGAGPAGYAAIEFCYNHFKPYGFIKTGDLGSTGFQLNLNRTDKAVVTAVEPGSAAAKADVRPGDEIIEVDGKPLTASSGENARELLFGKIGNQFHIKVRSGQTEKTVVLTLAGKQKE